MEALPRGAGNRPASRTRCLIGLLHEAPGGLTGACVLRRFIHRYGRSLAWVWIVPYGEVTLHPVP